ncbi:MAG: ABC transporter permease [Elusimicrobiota bacterium]
MTLKSRLSLPAFLWLGVFFILPLLHILLVSFSARGPYGGVRWGLGLGNYLRLSDPLYLVLFLRSLAVAGVSTLLCAALAFPISWWMARLPRPWQGISVLLILIPFWTNILVRLYAWIFILGRSGLFNKAAQALGLISAPWEILYTKEAILLGLVYGHLPFMILPLYAAMEKIDKGLIEAARDLYASSWQVFLRVILPLSKPGLVAGAALVFASIPCDFVTPDLLGGAKNMMLGNLIQQQYLTARDWPFGSAVSLMAMVVIGAGVMVYLRQESAS